MIYFSALLIAMFITIVLIPIFKRLARRLKVMDVPDERKVHTQPVPRIGGVAMALGALVPTLMWANTSDFASATLLGSWILVLFGLIDDRQNLNYKIKFASQFGAALLVILWGGVRITHLGMLLPDGVLLPDWISIPLTLLVIVGVTNAINLADGLDGLAGGIALLSFICIGYLAFRSDNLDVTMLSAAVCGAIFGFLRYNTHPAEVFMGDAGSQFLGFQAITLSLGLTQGPCPISPLVPLLLLGFPVLDTLTVMSLRVAEGNSPFYPDKNHFHHKLMRLGLYHSEAVLVIYALQALLVVAAFYLRFYSEWLILLLYLGFSVTVIFGFIISENRNLRFKRINFIDRVVKGRLKRAKEEKVFIKFFFRIVEFGAPAILLFTCFAPLDPPMWFSGFAAVLAVFLTLTWLTKWRYMRGALRLSLYLAVPLLIYISELQSAPWLSDALRVIYNLSFMALVLFVIITMRLSRREGFKSTPMDFLILFIAVVVPNIPGAEFETQRMGLVAVKIIILFFTYEVLIAELRGKLGRLCFITAATMLILALKGLI